MDVSERNSLIMANLELAKRIAMKKRHVYHIPFDEIKSAAYMGLVEAAKSFKPNENDSFPKFAIRRIIGAIQDYLRSISWNTRRNKNTVLRFKCEENDAIYFDTEIRQREFDEFLDELVKFLTDTQKMVVRLFYVEGKEIKEIAEHLKLTKFIVIGILKKIRRNLQETWENRYNELLLMSIRL